MTRPASDTPKFALVTGAGKRVGRAIAEGLAADGYAMALHYNASASGAEDLAREIMARGGQAVTLQQDLGQPETAGALIAKATEALGGPVTVLVNSASSFMADTFGTVTGTSWRFLMDVNAAAPVFLMQAFAEQDLTPAGGAIVNILDAQMTSASPDRVSYFCSKFALEGATRLAAYDFADRKIRVNAIAPGIILPSEQTQEEFEMRQSQTPLGQGLGPDDIVDAVRYLVRARHVTGHILAVDAGERLMGYGNAPFAAPE